MFKSNIPYFIKSCNSLNQVPDFKMKNIVIVGRSNAGKSSLINALAKQKIAKISKNPGCTKSLNFFNFYNKFILVDMPGYGYAKVSEKLKSEWNKFLYQYFSNKSIHLALILIDSKVGFKQTDFEMIDFLSFFKIPHIFVFTKLDKTSKLNDQIIQTLDNLTKNNIETSNVANNAIEAIIDTENKIENIQNNEILDIKEILKPSQIQYHITSAKNSIGVKELLNYLIKI